LAETSTSLGPLCKEACRAEILDVSPRGPPLSGAEPSSRNAVVVAQPPKLELELPYRMYRITRSDGSVPDRTDKHPFCMSRVYYDAAEKPEEVCTMGFFLRSGVLVEWGGGVGLILAL
jgi:hypothetical protein